MQTRSRTPKKKWREEDKNKKLVAFQPLFFGDNDANFYKCKKKGNDKTPRNCKKHKCMHACGMRADSKK